MLEKLSEFNKELTEMEEVLSKIDNLPNEVQEMMMNKFKQEVLGGGVMK